MVKAATVAEKITLVLLSLGSFSAFASDACSTSGSDFVKAFTSSIEVQASVIPSHLEYGRIQEGDANFSYLVETWPKSELKLFETGWFPLASERTRGSLDFSFEKGADGGLIIRLGKSDTDYSITYSFQMLDGCYLLNRINNDSL